MNYVANITRSEGDPKIIRSGPSSLGGVDRLARALGWFGIALGLAELLAPRSIARALGMQGRERLVRAYGAREIASGIVALSPDKQAGLWSRVAGDGLDVTTLLGAMRRDNPKRDNVAWALVLVLGVTMLDVLGAQGIQARHGRERRQRRLYGDRTGFPNGIEAARGAARPSQSARRGDRRLRHAGHPPSSV